MTEFDFGPGLRREERIDAAEGEAIEERWEIGRWMLSHVPAGAKKLPAGFLSKYAEASKRGRSELEQRIWFARKHPTRDAFLTAVRNHRTWTELRDSLGPEKEPAATVEPGPLPAGTFRTVVADPPWQYGNTSTRGAAEDHYSTMTIEELCALPVAERMAPDAHLYLWVTNNFIREAFEVMDAWGFAYKTCLTWVKPQMGMGNYFRGVTEHILFGAKGSLRTQARDIRNCFEAPRQKHSAKPDLFYDIVEKASPGPYLEMFARRARLGDWSYWGNESLETTELAA